MARLLELRSATIIVLAISLSTLVASNPVPGEPHGSYGAHSRPAGSGETCISGDGTCGHGKTCLGSGFGDCCSYYGFCGGEKDYCGTGCQKSYGLCGESHEVHASSSSKTHQSSQKKAHHSTQNPHSTKSLPSYGGKLPTTTSAQTIPNSTGTSGSGSLNVSTLTSEHHTSTPSPPPDCSRSLSEYSSPPAPSSSPAASRFSKSTTTAPPSDAAFSNCATKTITTTGATCPPRTIACGAIPDCILLSTIHLNCDCPATGLVVTSTVYNSCSEGLCQKGCGIDYTTVATPCPSQPSSTPSLAPVIATATMTTTTPIMGTATATTISPVIGTATATTIADNPYGYTFERD